MHMKKNNPRIAVSLWFSGGAQGRPLQPVVRRAFHAAAHSAESTSACSNTVCVAFSCLSGG